MINIPCPHCQRPIALGTMMSALSKGRPKHYTSEQIARLRPGWLRRERNAGRRNQLTRKRLVIPFNPQRSKPRETKKPMSKKDYIAIARAFQPHVQTAMKRLANFEGAKSGTEFARAQAELESLSLALDALAETFKSDNPAFKRGRWFSFVRGECGPNGGALKTKC